MTNGKADINLFLIRLAERDGLSDQLTESSQQPLRYLVVPAAPLVGFNADSANEQFCPRHLVLWGLVDANLEQNSCYQEHK